MDASYRDAAFVLCNPGNLWLIRWSMRIAIDARKLHDFGIGTYIRNTLRGLALLDPHTDYVILCRPDDAGTVGGLGPNFRAVPESAKPYSLGEQVRIPISLVRERAHLLHEPHYVLPPLTRCRSVVTIHDCIHLMFPQYLPSRLAHLYARASMWSAARISDRILTVSEASKRDILRFFDIPADKVEVIYNAIDERFLAPPDEPRMDLIRQRYQLDHPFVLYVGNIKPHKNLERLIDAFARTRAAGLDDLRLVIIGDELSKYPPLRQAVHRHRVDKYVRFLGFQPYETLAAFYRLARAFAFPSLYEGFGLPPLEAMACGTPVVTSNVSSLPEIAGGAAVLVDPYEPSSIADGLIKAVTDDSLRRDLIARGLARARDFSWTLSAAATHRNYMEVLER
ncbi:MAG TPA: glycosyltransferase family 1 protein [Vicinamibacterales bacterium]|nr:glycosyltransferase family 1 protein [Vicinamibacterales bacterium]